MFAQDTLITAQGLSRMVKPKNGKAYTTTELQDYVGGYIELVPLDTEWFMVVDEEGLLRERRLNKLASTLAARPIVGDVLIVHSNTLG